MDAEQAAQVLGEVLACPESSFQFGTPVSHELSRTRFRGAWRRSLARRSKVSAAAKPCWALSAAYTGLLSSGSVSCCKGTVFVTTGRRCGVDRGCVLWEPSRGIWPILTREHPLITRAVERIETRRSTWSHVTQRSTFPSPSRQGNFGW